MIGKRKTSLSLVYLAFLITKDNAINTRLRTIKMIYNAHSSHSFLNHLALRKMKTWQSTRWCFRQFKQ